MASGAIKKATGLTGLAVVINPHQKLSILYDKILRTLQRIPEQAAYRKHTEAIIKDRLSMVKSEPDVFKLEQKINSGQIEEVILQAERELQLSRKMLEWKAWEPLIEQPPKNQWQWPLK